MKLLILALFVALSLLQSGSFLTADASPPDSHAFQVIYCDDCTTNWLGQRDLAHRLNFTCEKSLNGMEGPFCICSPGSEGKKARMWKVLGQEGDKKCTVTKFGPCGYKQDIHLECSGSLECRNEMCIDPKNPVSGINEDCEITQNCEKGLDCRRKSHKCVKSYDLVGKKAGQSCGKTDECDGSLVCKSNEKGKKICQSKEKEQKQETDGAAATIVQLKFWLIVTCFAYAYY